MSSMRTDEYHMIFMLARNNAAEKPPRLSLLATDALIS
jgi:hypothetical protein